ncbi:hypothetical protein [Geminisphaera colitermitum]|uniref:hypothetical protein n=1 Tax=Geminisphaera colitermitum TaxID=1148786 RepID=UPI000158D580|nr:hypothetical protein [Geminisphaera colitermitum]
MNSYRRASQKSVGFYADEQFVSLLRSHLKKKRVNQSQFIRDAIAEKMAREGVIIPDDLVLPRPPYSGPKKVKFSITNNHGIVADKISVPPQKSKSVAPLKRSTPRKS